MSSDHLTPNSAQFPTYQADAYPALKDPNLQYAEAQLADEELVKQKPDYCENLLNAASKVVSDEPQVHEEMLKLVISLRHLQLALRHREAGTSKQVAQQQHEAGML